MTIFLTSYKEYILIAYLIISWSVFLYLKLTKKGNEINWLIVLFAPFVIPIVFSYVLAVSVFNTIINIHETPLAFISFIVTQFFFVIPFLPAIINGGILLEEFSITWNHFWQYMLLSLLFSLYILLRFVWKFFQDKNFQDKKIEETKFNSILFVIILGSYIFAILLFVDLIYAQTCISWQIALWSAPSFLAGSFIDKHRNYLKSKFILF